MRYVLTTLAEYQTDFWHPVARSLRAAGHKALFLSFDDRSTDRLRADGFVVHDATAPVANLDPAATIARFGISDLNHWLSHERFAFGVGDGERLQQKFARSLVHAETFLASQRGADLQVVQEVGGFLSVIGTWFAARAASLPHWFIEPAFFKGRLFFTEGGFDAPKVKRSGQAAPAEAIACVERTAAARAIVIPEKDRHQYTTAGRKFANAKNARRLVTKLVDKYVHGKTQEFGHIGHHVRTHAVAVANSLRLRGAYTTLSDMPRFVYFPLHVPGDIALTLRSPEYLDQLAFIDYLCRSVPATHHVAIKEHPAMVGALGAEPLLKLLARYDNLHLLPPTTNNYEVLGAADLVVTINSKSGAEGGMLGRPVIVMGDAFYRDAPFSMACADMRALRELLPATLKASASPPGEATMQFLGDVYRQTVPGELYVAHPDNVATFTASMLMATEGAA